MLERHPGNHVGHRQQHDHERRTKAPPKPAAHVIEFRVGPFDKTHHFRLQRHPANPTSSWCRFKHFRIHRTNVFDCRASRNRHRSHRALIRRQQIVGWVLTKLGKTTRCAEMVGSALIRIGTGRGRRLHRHAADRVDGSAARHRGHHHGERFSYRWNHDEAQRFLAERTLRVCTKPFKAGRRTEIVGQAFVLILARCSRRIDGHTANGIDRHKSPVKRDG